MEEEIDYFEKLKQLFKIDGSLYKEPVRHYSENVGLSCYRIPDKALLKRIEVEDGDEYRTLVKIGFNPYRRNEGQLQPILIIMSFCLYKNGEYTLDFNRINSKVMLPYEIKDTEHYFNLETHEICTEDKRSIDGSELIEKIYYEHIKLTKPIISIWYSIRVFLVKDVSKSIIQFLYSSGNIILKIFTGDIYKRKKEKINIYNLKNDVETPNEDKLFDFFGLKVKAIPLFTYSMFHICGYIVFTIYNIYPKWVKVILEYNLLTVVYVITSYSLYTKIPELVFKGYLSIVDNILRIIERKIIKP